MAGEYELMRMLEPAVRPIGTPAQSIQPRQPIEQQNFDQLLREASQITRPDTTQQLSFSQHAQVELSEIDVKLTDTQTHELGTQAQIHELGTQTQTHELGTQTQTHELGTQAQIHEFPQTAQQVEVDEVKESLLLIRQLGMIVNLHNRTVVNVLSLKPVTTDAITNIDSTVLVSEPDTGADRMDIGNSE